MPSRGRWQRCVIKSPLLYLWLACAVAALDTDTLQLMLTLRSMVKTTKNGYTSSQSRPMGTTKAVMPESIVSLLKERQIGKVKEDVSRLDCSTIIH